MTERGAAVTAKQPANSADKVAILKRKKQNLMELFDNYQKLLDAKNVKGQGLREKEIKLFREEYERLNTQFREAKVLDEIEKVKVDLNASMRQFTELRRERTEDIDAFMNRIDSIKKFN